MTATRVTITFDRVAEGAQPISGAVHADRQPPCPFTGWTELFGLLRTASEQVHPTTWTASGSGREGE